MYKPNVYQWTDREEIYSLIDTYPFAILCSQVNGQMDASHLPLALDRERGQLLGHFARNNPHWQALDHQNALVIFQGPHSYISPDWYETNLAVPTWNYVTVHIHGTVHLIQDDKAVCDTLFAYQRAFTHRAITDEQAALIASMSHGVVGFTLQIERIEAVQKLNQKHSIERRKQTIAHLKEQKDENARKIAELMQQTLDASDNH
ncbi:MAG: FMN-binding negative transcriptional regulator [Sporolactobacillus sp.]